MADQTPRGLSLWLECCCLAGVCVAATAAAITLARLSGGDATISLADGFVLALLLSRERRNWAIYLVAGGAGGMAVAFFVGRPAAEVVPTVLIQSAEIFTAAWLLRRRIGAGPDLSARAAFRHFLVIAGFVAPVVLSAVGAALLHVVSGQPVLATFLASAAAIAIGNLLATPLGLAVLRGELGPVFAAPHALRHAAWLLAAIALTLAVFLQVRYPLLFLMPPMLSAVAGVTGFAGVALLMPLLAGIVLACTSLGFGPFCINPNLSAIERLVLVQLFSCACLLLARTVANLVKGRDEALEAERRKRDLLHRSQLDVAASEARFRLVAENAKDVISWVGPGNEQLYVSPAVSDVFGVSPEEFMARGKLAFVHPQDRDQVRAIMAALASGSLTESAVRYRVAHPRHGEVWVESRSRALPVHAGGDVGGYISVIRDITQQMMEAERQDVLLRDLEAANERTRLAADSGGIGIFDWNIIENTMFWDDWMCRHYNIARPTEADTFELWGSMLHPADRGAAEQAVRGAIEHDAPYDTAFRIIWTDGSIHTLKAFGKVVRDADGRAVRMIGTNWDITPQRKLEGERDEREAELHRANAELDKLARHFARARKLADQANRAKTRFLAGMSHELRTPLHGILGYAQLLDMDGGLTVTQAERVQAMMVAGTHLLKMVSGVLELSEAESDATTAETDATDIRHTAKSCLDIIRPQADRKHIALVLDVAAQVPARVRLDAKRLRQVLLNLLGNAVKYTPSGTVTLLLTTTPGDKHVRLEVRDTGPGIPEAKRHLLFEEFERLDARETGSEEGAGLGLSLARRVVGIMGGTIGQDNDPAGGSIFWLELPLVSEPAGSEGATDTAGIQLDRHWAVNSEAVSMQVLVVDDVEMNRDIATAFIRSAGYEVTTASGGAEAVERIAREDFLVVLMDVQMPGLDGLEATRRVRALDGPRSGVPIIAMTAQTFAEQLLDCREAGMNTHLAKPFTLNSLLEAIECGLARQHVPARQQRLAIPDQGREMSVLNKIDTAVWGEEFPLVDEEAMIRTASFLNAEMVEFYLGSLIDKAQALKAGLAAGDFRPERAASLGDAAHALAGSAGMFGLERLVFGGRHFERAVASDPASLPAAAAGLSVILEKSIVELQRRVKGKEAVLS